MDSRPDQECTWWQVLRETREISWMEALMETQEMSGNRYKPSKSVSPEDELLSDEDVPVPEVKHVPIPTKSQKAPPGSKSGPQSATVSTSSDLVFRLVFFLWQQMATLNLLLV